MVTTVAEYIFGGTNKKVLSYITLQESSKYTYNGLNVLIPE